MSSPGRYAQLTLEIIERVTERQDEPAEVARAVEHAFSGFIGVMSTLLGDKGARALLQRALHLTRKKLQAETTVVSLLPAAIPNEGWDALVRHAGKARSVACAAMMLEEVLELLADFIGEELTVRLVRRTWADIEAVAKVPPREEA